MQICSNCAASSQDNAQICHKCGLDLREYSTTAVALKKFQNNTRVKNVRLVVPDDACPACRDVEGTYPKDQAPRLPVEGCSEKHGCQAFYEPMLNEIYP
jgi:RNA polymerase subunit RPABC4/transcription elongation factor Spt4